jgi:uncharacterized protein
MKGFSPFSPLPVSPQASFHFSPELTDFLLPGQRNASFSYTFEQSPSIKHLVESLGVPHVEVARILVNGLPVGFDYRVQDGDRIEVHSFNQQASEGNGNLDDDLPGQGARFVLDNHLGKLAIYLRLLGFDAWYRNDYEDDELVWDAVKENRILLTRDRRLLMRRILTYGYCVRSLDPKSQVREVVSRFRLFEQIRPFRRCLRCNHGLQPVSKEEILHRLESLTKAYYNDFHLCPSCDQIYWKGSHYERMLVFLQDLWKGEE